MSLKNRHGTELQDSFAPSLFQLRSDTRTHDGRALAYGLDGSRQPATSANGEVDEAIAEVQLSEDGIVRLLNKRMSDSRSFDGPQQWLFEQIPAILTRQFIGIVGDIAYWCRYGGEWGLAIAVMGIGGLPLYRSGTFATLGNAFVQADMGEYRRDTTATSAEI